jgi:tetratricopeptide (TPR) repeat protein
MIKNGVFILLLIFALLGQSKNSQLLAAAYNKPTNLINIPIPEEITLGDLEFGLSNGIFNGRTMDFDYKVNYSVTNRLKLGFTYLSATDFVGNIHFNLTETKLRGIPMKFSGGLLNISGTTSVSSWDNYTSGVDNNFSPYVVSKWEFNKYNIYTGLGKRDFQGTGNTGMLSGLFYGLELSQELAFGGKAMAEFDGKDFNIGYMFDLGKRTKLNIAFTELMNETSNPNYNNAPTRKFTIALTFKENMFLAYRDKRKSSVDKKLQELEDMQYDIHKFQSEYLSTYKKLKKDKKKLSTKIYQMQKTLEDENKYVYHVYPDQKVDHLKPDTDMDPEVIRLYYDAFEQYSQEEYYRAITSLIKAININPYVSELYTRLGSIYYELDLEDDAIVAWQRALELDPNNLELINFLSEFEI